MNLEQLKELGLSEGQVAVYTAVLELGISSLNKIQEKNLAKKAQTLTPKR